MFQIEKDIEIKKHLEDVWSAFFGSYSHLLAIQRETIPLILEGKNVVVVSPAATGKTEAVCAPLAQLIINNNWTPLSIVYIAPTRALVNNIWQRLREPLYSVGISISRKTSDKPQFNPKKPTHFVITTPEGFDSLIARHPAVMQYTKAVVLDELHQYDDTYRGDAVRVLLRRLERLTKKMPIYCAISATIPNPYMMAKRYFDNFAIVRLHTLRRIDYKIFDFELDLKQLLNSMKDDGVKKAIMFANLRKDAEEIAFLLRLNWEYSDYVWVHHASLDKRQRENVEELFLHSRVGIVVATTTLELGIDVSDVDCVILYSPPPSVRSLMQRLGRACRNTSITKAYAIARNKWERIIFRFLFLLAEVGWIEEEYYSPCISVACQQLFSYLYQRRHVGTTLDVLKELLQLLSLNEQQIEELIWHLAKKNYLRVDCGKYFLGERMERKAERGLIHSNIEQISDNQEVIDITTGNTIGYIDYLRPNFVLKGKLWTIVKESDGHILAKETEGSAFVYKTFQGKGLALWDVRLGKELRCNLFNEIKSVNQLPYQTISDNMFYVYHFFGYIWGYIWAEALCINKKLKAKEFEGCYLSLENISKKDLPIILQFTGEELLQTVLKLKNKLKKFLNLGSYFSFMPESLQDYAIERAVGLEGLVKVLRESQLIEVE